MIYEYAFSGFVKVIANSEEEAFEMVDRLVAPTTWASDNCEEITVDDISLLDVEEDEE